MYIPCDDFWPLESNLGAEVDRRLLGFLGNRRDFDLPMTGLPCLEFGADFMMYLLLLDGCVASRVGMLLVSVVAGWLRLRL